MAGCVRFFTLTQNFDRSGSAGRGALRPALQDPFCRRRGTGQSDLAALERIDEDALGPAGQQPFEVGLAQVQGQLAQVVAALGQDVEGAELHFVVVLARVQVVEVGDAVNAEHDRFAVDDELLDAVLARRLGDPRIALGPVIAAPRDQPDAIAVAL